MLLKEQAKEIRKLVLKMVYDAQTSHVGAALSIVDILTVLYAKILKIDLNNLDNYERDRFILSKGHACTALYATLAYNKIISEDYINNYCCDGGKLFGHPNSKITPGVEFSTGSLGHGLSIGAGMALAAKIDGNPCRTFVLLGDGECNEGQIWEATMFSAQHNLDNLNVIIDHNKLQGFGKTEGIIDLKPFAAKWEAFGWTVKEINGHDYEEIEKTLSFIPIVKKKPTVIIAHTIKGKGVSFMEDKLEWHYKSPRQEQYELALAEVEKL